MGKGLSPLQKQILAVPPAETLPENGVVNLGSWMRPREVIAALDREPTPSDYTTISKALARLVERDLVVAMAGSVRTRGSGYRYALARG